MKFVMTGDYSCRMMQKKSLFCLKNTILPPPGWWSENKLGMITVDDVMEVAREEFEEDIYCLAG